MEEQKLTTEQKEENLAMEFDAEMAEEFNNVEIDQELLQLQKRKSTPKVTIEEFVQGVDSDEECPNAEKEGKKPHKVKTHYEIDDVSKLFNSYPLFSSVR